MLILDSNTISYYFRGDPQVVPRLQAIRPADLGVPAVVEYELRYGLLRLPEEVAAPRLDALARFLRPLRILAFARLTMCWVPLLSPSQKAINTSA